MEVFNSNHISSKDGRKNASLPTKTNIKEDPFQQITLFYKNHRDVLSLIHSTTPYDQ